MPLDARMGSECVGGMRFGSPVRLLIFVEKLQHQLVEALG